MVTEDVKVLASYFQPDGRLKDIPRQLKKKLAIYRYIIMEFQPARSYTEREVNEMLMRFFDDYCSLRRDLVDLGFLNRDHGIYWRIADGSSNLADRQTA